MPSVKLRCPQSIGDAEYVMRGLILATKRIVAREMSGRNYDGDEFFLDEKYVEVIIDPYDEKRVSLSSRYPMEITGYDYPDRMEPEPLTRKLTTIADDMGFELGRLLSQLLFEAERDAARMLGQVFFSVTFIPYSDGCYASSSR
jgi:hypothetical protein